jgi:hypothetical protein
MHTQTIHLDSRCLAMLNTAVLKHMDIYGTLSGIMTEWVSSCGRTTDFCTQQASGLSLELSGVFCDFVLYSLLEK